jgi:hypothetical protein
MYNLTGNCEQNPDLLVFPEEEQQVLERLGFIPRHVYHLRKNPSGRYSISPGGKMDLVTHFHQYSGHIQKYPRMISWNMVSRVWPSQLVIRQIRLLTKDLNMNTEKKIEYLSSNLANIVTDHRDFLISVAKIATCHAYSDYHEDPKFHMDSSLVILFSGLFPRLQRKIMQFWFSGEDDAEVKYFVQYLFLNQISFHLPKFNNEVPVIIKNNGILKDEIWRAWIKNPLTRQEFFLDSYLDEKIPETNQNIHLLPTSLKKHIIDVDQRSEKWVDIYNNFNKKTDKKSGSNRYGLFRGNVGEKIVLHNLTELMKTWSYKPELISVGMIISPEGKMICPDGLLFFPKEIIPIEIKTLTGYPRLCPVFLRSYDMGVTQIYNAAKVINDHCGHKISKRGLLIFLFIHPKNEGYIFRIFLMEKRIA